MLDINIINKLTATEQFPFFGLKKTARRQPPNPIKLSNIYNQRGHASSRKIPFILSFSYLFKLIEKLLILFCFLFFWSNFCQVARHELMRSWRTAEIEDTCHYLVRYVSFLVEHNLHLKLISQETNEIP